MIERIFWKLKRGNVLLLAELRIRLNCRFEVRRKQRIVKTLLTL